MAVPFLIPAAVAIAAEVFPTLATRLGGARGQEVATRAVELAAKAAGLPAGADPSDILATLRRDPARAQELRLQFAALDEAEHGRIVADRASARAFQATGGRFRGNAMLVGVVGGLVSIVGAVILGDVGSASDPGTLALLTTMAGALLKMLSDAFAFEFGSSSGSKEKSAHIEQIQSALIRVAEDRSGAPETSPPPADTVPNATPPALLDQRPGKRDFVAELRRMS